MFQFTLLGSKIIILAAYILTKKLACYQDMMQQGDEPKNELTTQPSAFL